MFLSPLKILKSRLLSLNMDSHRKKRKKKKLNIIENGIFLITEININANAKKC